MKINAHSHLLPYPEEIPSFMKEKKVFWIDEERKYMRQNDWKRPITDTSFFLVEKLAWMKKNNIDLCVVLNLSQLYCNGYEQMLCKDVIQFQNDFNYSIQTKYPEKFIGAMVVQPLFIEDALEEIHRCSGRGQKVLCLPTHYLDLNFKWKATSQNSCMPIYELANDLKLSIEYHPYDAEKIIDLDDEAWRFHLIWMCAMTADNYHFFSLNNLAKNYPDIKFCFAHGNQFGQVNYGRRIQGYNGRPDLFEGMNHPSENISYSNVFFDTLVHDPYTIQTMKRIHGSGQIVAGIDDPYPLGEMESVRDSYPGKVIDDAVMLGFLTSEEANDIWYKNVKNWLNI